MAGKQETKRNDLRKRLIGATEFHIETHGIHSLNARDVTTTAGCALGSLYTVFRDLDDLVVHVNSRTLGRLGEAIQAAKRSGDDPVDMLKDLARGYVRFARDNYALWVALFDYAVLTGKDIPDWHQNEQALLIVNIAEPVAMLNPEMTDKQCGTLSRLLFSAVHGIVSNSLADRFVGVSKNDLENELMDFIDQMVAGFDPAK